MATQTDSHAAIGSGSGARSIYESMALTRRIRLSTVVPRRDRAKAGLWQGQDGGP
jgi:hypothetical protein